MALLSIFDISASALTAQSQRLNVSASNMANAESVAGPDGEPYRAKQVMFQTAPQGRYDIGGVKVSQLIEDRLRRVWSTNPVIRWRMKRAMCGCRMWTLWVK